VAGVFGALLQREHTQRQQQRQQQRQLERSSRVAKGTATAGEAGRGLPQGNKHKATSTCEEDVAESKRMTAAMQEAAEGCAVVAKDTALRQEVQEAGLDVPDLSVALTGENAEAFG